MKILAVSDVESKYFFDYYSPGKLKDFDQLDLVDLGTYSVELGRAERVREQHFFTQAEQKQPNAVRELFERVGAVL